MRKSFSKIAVAVLSLYIGFSFSPCYGEFSLEARDRWSFNKTSSTLENLDNNKFKNAAYTSAWKTDLNFVTHILEGRLIWRDPSKFYAMMGVNYGWLVDGVAKEYPRCWHVGGHQKGLKLEVGYLMDVCERFHVIPRVGFRNLLTDITLHHEHFILSTPNSYVKRSGNQTHTALNFGFIGFDLVFSKKWNCRNLEFATGYQLSYGGGSSHTKVHRTIITDDPNTSNYGVHVKYRDMISHQFEVASAYSVAKHWQLGFKVDYNITYNTHNLPVKLDHNKKIVQKKQFAKSQYHVLSEDLAQTWGVTFILVYNFGAGTDWVISQ